MQAFFSYAHEDWETAAMLCKRMEARGLSVWFDRQQIDPAQSLDDQIFNAIKESRFFLLLLSPISCGKAGYIRREITLALQVAERFGLQDKFIIPIRTAECTPTREESLGLATYLDLFEKGGTDSAIAAIAMLMAERDETVSMPASPHDAQIKLCDARFNEGLAKQLHTGNAIAIYVANCLATLGEMQDGVLSRKIMNIRRDVRMFANCLEMQYFRGIGEADPKAHCRECAREGVVHGHADLGGVECYDNYFILCPNCFCSWHKEEFSQFYSADPPMAFSYATNGYERQPNPFREMRKVSSTAPAEKPKLSFWKLFRQP